MPHFSRLLNKPAAGTCRLFIRIDGVCYGLTKVDSRPSAVEVGWRLRKANGDCYDVARTESGYTCDCPDFAFRRDGIDPDGCKHVKALRVVGLLP